MRPGAHILFVERDGTNREALRQALESEGYQVACAADEREALDQLRQGERPRLALLDLTSGVQGAARFVQQLKQDAASASIPVIVFCPRQRDAYPGALLEADALLRKPVEFDELLATVRRFCAGQATPAPPPETVRLRPAARPKPAGPRRRVLIVEDNRDGADSLRMLLQLLGHEVCVAYTGPEGVDVARAWRPDIVLCDIGLPGLDGYEVASELRRDPATAGARLIAITGYGSEEAKRRSRESGFDLHLTKPANPSVLLQLLTAAEGAA